MKQTFNYRPKTKPMDMLWGIVLPLLVIVVPIVYPFSIGFGSFTLVPYPWSMYLMIVVGVALLFGFYNRTKKESALKKAGCQISVEDGKVTVPCFKGGKVEELTFSVAEVESTEYDIEDGEFKLTVGGKEHTFDKDYFESDKDFSKFMGVFKE